MESAVNQRCCGQEEAHAVIQPQCRVQDFLFVLGFPNTISLKALTSPTMVLPFVGFFNNIISVNRELPA
jgi:hypothetical protein